MQIIEVEESIALIVPMFLLVAGIVALVAWFAMGSKGGRGARIAAWLGLVTLTLWCGSIIAFGLLMLTYFALGSQATILLAVLVTIFMVTMPFGWAWIVMHRSRDETAPGETSGTAGPTGTPQAH